jgi:hypothetical protein
MFVGKARSLPYPRVEHLKGASLRLAPALPSNIRLGWKGLPWTNALAYYEHSKLRRKKFYNIEPRLERPLRDKYSSSLGIFVSYGQKSFITLKPE